MLADGVVLRHNSSLGGEIRYAEGLIEIGASGDDRELGRFRQQGDRLLFEGSDYELNGKPAEGASQLGSGDQLSFPGSQQRFSLIEVSDGR